jgi:cytochrome c oxidase subunit 2
MRIDRPGIYRGQCSEICGAGHGYMPIVIEALSENDFYAWLNEAKNEFATLKNRTIALSK